MNQDLDKFFSEKTIVDVDRSTFLVCNLKDNAKKIIISLVFLKDWDSIESDGYNSVIVNGVGAVLTFPCYWVSVPKELCMAYFTYIIDSLYAEHFNNWGITTGNGSQNIGNNCGCYRPPCGVV